MMKELLLAKATRSSCCSSTTGAAPPHPHMLLLVFVAAVNTSFYKYLAVGVLGSWLSLHHKHNKFRFSACLLQYQLTRCLQQTHPARTRDQLAPRRGGIFMQLLCVWTVQTFRQLNDFDP